MQAIATTGEGMYSSLQPLPQVRKRARREIQKRGKYWQWRIGSHGNRRAEYGGKFERLPEERKQEYERNKEIYHARRANKARAATDNESGGIRDA